MAITYGFFDAVSGDRVYNAAQMTEYFDGLVSNGVYESIGGKLQVAAVSGQMKVTVATGRAIIDCRWFKSDEAVTLNISAAHAILPRYTAVVLRLNYDTRTIGLYTKDGTAASNPVKPSVTRSATVKELCLAQIYIPAGSTAVSQSRITDTRADSTVCGWVTGLIKQVDTSELFLQWQTAYAEFFASFQSWFDTLTSELQVNTYIKEYSKRKSSSTLSQLASIPLDMDGYTYEEADIINVYINGVLIVRDSGWTLDTSGSDPIVRITFNSNSGGTNEVYIQVLKSKIGDPVGGGSHVETLNIQNTISSSNELDENPET
jgi:hypothetical protein